MRMPPALRWFWRIYIPIALAALTAIGLFIAGPVLEARFWPIRVSQPIEDVHRDAGTLRFVWHSTKLRMAPSNDIDVFVSTPSDHFPWTLANDLSPEGGPPCKVLAPWSHGYTVDVGEHRQHYCIELPRTVAPEDPVTVRVVAHYRGLWGLWDLPVAFPPIEDPPAESR